MARIVNTFDPAERFVVGTVGEPGERTFFLQARTGKKLISVSLDKSQVIAMAERLELLMRELRRVDPSIILSRVPRDDQPLETPILDEFRVGVIALSWLSDRELVSVELQAINETSPENDEIAVDEEGEGPDLLRVFLTPAQTDSFIKRSMAVVNAGRPPCPFCGLALDPRGHLCPRANGYRR